MALRDLFFGKEEEEEQEETPALPKEKPVTPEVRRDKPGSFGNFNDLDTPVEVTPPPVQPPKAFSQAELDAEVKALQDELAVEKKDKGLGAEYYGFLKALGNEDDADAYQRTLRTMNAVREQFSVGSTLTWKMLIDSAKSCLTWLSSHAGQKASKLQAERQSSGAALLVKIQKAEIAIKENEEQIKRLQREIEEQKAARQAALDAQKKAELEYEKRKTILDTASVQLANDIATDIARFQGES